MAHERRLLGLGVVVWPDPPVLRRFRGREVGTLKAKFHNGKCQLTLTPPPHYSAFSALMGSSPALACARSIILSTSPGFIAILSGSLGGKNIGRQSHGKTKAANATGAILSASHGFKMSRAIACAMASSTDASTSSHPNALHVVHGSAEPSRPRAPGSNLHQPLAHSRDLRPPPGPCVRSPRHVVGAVGHVAEPRGVARDRGRERSPRVRRIASCRNHSDRT